MINSRDLQDLRPDVLANCKLWIKMCEEAGLYICITQTLRDNEYQEKLYAKGRTEPGKIVTNSKVVTFHGKGLAFDFCKNKKGYEYDDIQFFEKAADIAKKIGFSWGGDWKSFVDKPHIQWDNHGEYTDSMIKKNILPPQMPYYNETPTKSVVETFDASKLTDKECYDIMIRAEKYAASVETKDSKDSKVIVIVR